MNIKWIRVASIRFALRSSLFALRSPLSPPSPLPPLSLVLINISQFKVLHRGSLGYPFDRPPRFNLKFLKLQSFPPIYIYVLNYSPIIIFPKIDEQTTKFIINFLLYILIIEKKKKENNRISRTRFLVSSKNTSKFIMIVSRFKLLKK